jgi:hypothetical protein
MNTISTEEFQRLKQLWADKFPSVTLPGDKQWEMWLRLHDFEIVKYGLKRTGKKFVQLNTEMSYEYILRFASKVMNMHGKRPLPQLIAPQPTTSVDDVDDSWMEGVTAYRENEDHH